MELPPNFKLASGRGDADPRALGEDFERQIAVALCAFIRYSTEDALVYAELSGRSTVQPRDCLLALKSLAVGHFWRKNDLPEVIQWATAQIDDPESSSDDESNEGDDSDAEDSKEDEHTCDEEEVWCAAETAAEVISDEQAVVARLNRADDEFDAWVPQNPMEMAVANAVIHSEQSLDSLTSM